MEPLLPRLIAVRFHLDRFIPARFVFENWREYVPKVSGSNAPRIALFCRVCSFVGDVDLMISFLGNGGVYVRINLHIFVVGLCAFLIFFCGDPSRPFKKRCVSSSC